MLKSEIEIEIGPIHHQLTDRIRDDATICFTALILYAVWCARGRTPACSASRTSARCLVLPAPKQKPPPLEEVGVKRGK